MSNSSSMLKLDNHWKFIVEYNGESIVGFSAETFERGFLLGADNKSIYSNCLEGKGLGDSLVSIE